MGARLASAVSPYLRAHADNPVDWWPWGPEAFEAARRRDVPVLVSIGYATCHWCHVMARESFADPVTAAMMNAGFVAIKVDREEHPEVDAAFLAAASAFTQHLGWPLTVVTTPEGRTFFAGTYFPPESARGMPSFRQVLDAATEAWTQRRDEVEALGQAVTNALRAQPQSAPSALPDGAALATAVRRIAETEDPVHGGFGTAPKFPNVPVLAFLAERRLHGDESAAALVERLHAATRALQDAIEGGYYRYAVQRDWSEPHYERMLADNAQLLDIATSLGDEATAVSIAGFLMTVLRRGDGAFGSAQDSESLVDGVRSEGGYYALDAAARATQPPPAVDGKVLAGLNGLAIGALADAGVRFDRPEWVVAAARAAAYVRDVHVRSTPEGPRLARASLDGVTSPAVATLEDYGGLAGGLVRLALATGEAAWAVLARELVAACADGRAPGGSDPVLVAHGIAIDADRSDDASPSGIALLADATARLDGIGVVGLRGRAEALLAPSFASALGRPTGYGATLAVAARLAAPPAEVVIVTDDPASPLAAVARAWARPTRTLAIVTSAQAAAFAAEGCELFAERSTLGGAPAAYLCAGGVCRLPTREPSDLAAQLAS